MAIVTAPLMSAEARGSVHHLTFNTWRGKNTVKLRSGPHVPDTGGRLAALQFAHDADANWKALQPSEREAWNDWAAQQREPHWTGQDLRLTGHNWFVRIYVRQSLTSGDATMLIPNYAIHYTLEGFYLDTFAGSLRAWWTYADFPEPGDYWVEVYLTAPLSAGRNATIHNATRVAAWTIDSPPVILRASAAGTFTAFGRFVHLTGLVTPYQSSRLTIT
jgi:hypothetical protein